MTAEGTVSAFLHVLFMGVGTQCLLIPGHSRLSSAIVCPFESSTIVCLSSTIVCPFAPELCHCVHMHSRISVQRFTAPTPYLALHYSHRQSPQTTDYNACWPHKCITNLLLMMLHLFSCSLLPYRSSNLKQRYVSLHRRSCQTTVCGACWPGWR